MPRGARLVVPEVALHVVQRGHNRQPCFRHDTDYLVYLANLMELARKTRCGVHAYCLMTNHVHLFLTPPATDACARLMRNLGQRYVQYFNRRYARTGTLWEGRPHTCLVDSARYVIACYRYIEFNPVRAGMVEKPSQYFWSSHNGNSGHASNGLLTPHTEYLALAPDDASRHLAYRELFAAGEEPSLVNALRDATNGGFALIGDQLKSMLPAEMQERLARRTPGPRPQLIGRDTGTAELELELGLRPGIS